MSKRIRKLPKTVYSEDDDNDLKLDEREILHIQIRWPDDEFDYREEAEILDCEWREKFG